MVATIGGVLVMWGLVSYLHSGDAHAHGSEQGVHSEEDHHDKEGIHSEEDHSHEDHE
jgi:ZIP family zinc transporter